MAISREFWFRYSCTDCGSDDGFRSTPRTFTERYIVPLLLMHPVGCANCFRRDWRSIFTPVKARTEEIRERKHKAA